MPTRAPRACPRCGHVITERRCLDCYPAWHGSAWRTHNGGQRWDRIKAKRRKANPICQHCGIRLATVVDHITPLSAGGALHDYANTQSLCDPCHAAKTAAEARAARTTPPHQH